MALFCGQSAIAAGGIYRAIQQKTDNAACERFLNFTMPGNWLRDTCSLIAVPIVLPPCRTKTHPPCSINLIRSARFMA
jgi:hypothetical protein